MFELSRLVVRTKALVLELLAAVCLVRGGHDIILVAFDNVKEVRLVAVVNMLGWMLVRIVAKLLEI